MTLDEFRRHPVYDYYIRTLVSDCLVCDLETKFDNQYTIIYMIVLIIILIGKNVAV